ncbi:MAG: hypothetical protein JWN93_942 [Hyphomicrobiales bacterium]|nr:hypothetical protein [Hyphomicrobiales bacterium]
MTHGPGTGLTRRAALGVLAGAGALPRVALAQAGRAADCDVVVIGAGAAGVAAARELRGLGKSCIVLEARDRVGGRTFTDRSLGQPWDAGALYIHWAENNPWTELAKAYGVETVDSDTLKTGSRFIDRGDGAPVERPRGGGGGRGGFAAVQALFDTELADVPDVSFMDRVGGADAEGAGAVMSIARMALGDEPERISALDYARLWSGDDLLLPQGYGSLVEKAAEGLDIRLGAPVSLIDWSGPGVRVTTPAGALTARAAIVTIPVGALKAGGVRFTPELPQATRDGLAGLGMGALSKIAMRFNGERFGMTPGMDLWERLGPRASFNFECWQWDRDLVIAYFGGDHARDVVAQGEQGAVALALEEFSRIVGGGAQKAFVAGRLAGWSADPWAMGCYSHALPGCANARALLAQPVGERIWFAGEATAGSGPGENFGAAMTAGGAYLAGRAAARDAARA